jgi:glycosyltransferase involved in cell wall biosynthesis
MINNHPLVSVIVPCYNHENYIKECLLSVINQSYKNIELIVIDDGSSDNSIQIINQLRTDYEFIFEAQANRGISATLNKGIQKYASGKYISILASDDFWHPNKLEKQVAFMEFNKGFAMVCSNSYIVNSQSRVDTFFNEKLFDGLYSFNEIALGKCLIPALTVLIRRDTFDKVGYFDENLLIEDLDMWLRISYSFKIGVLKEKLAYYRKHSTNVSSRSLAMSASRFKILKKWQHLPTNIYTKIERNWELIALNEFWDMYPDEAIKYFNPSFRKLLNSSYRKFAFKYFVRYVLKLNLR